jgi:hypothetical protein
LDLVSFPVIGCDWAQQLDTLVKGHTPTCHPAMAGCCHLHSVTAEGTYEVIVEGHYGDHQLATSYHFQLKARTQLSVEPLQEFATTIMHLALWGLVEQPQHFIQEEVAHAFVSRIRAKR